MTVIILRQIHKMLCNAQRCIRYKNPTKKEVCIQSGLVLLWASFLGVWPILPYDWNVPIRTYPQQGYACVPIEYSFPSSLFYFLVFFPCMSGIPLLYTTYVIFNIWRKSLLPKKGQRRIFAVYMMRIIVTMYFWWLPSIMFKYFIPSLINPWAKAFFSIWMHLQGMVSSGMMLGKPDINKAVKGFLTCRADPCVALCGRPPIPDDSPSPSKRGKRGPVGSANPSYINLGWGSRFRTSVSRRFSSVTAFTFRKSSAGGNVDWSTPADQARANADSSGTKTSSDAPVSSAADSPNAVSPENDDCFVENEEESAKLQPEEEEEDGDDDQEYGYGKTVVEEADGAEDPIEEAFADEEAAEVGKVVSATIPEE